VDDSTASKVAATGHGTAVRGPSIRSMRALALLAILLATSAAADDGELVTAILPFPAPRLSARLDSDYRSTVAATDGRGRVSSATLGARATVRAWRDDDDEVTASLAGERTNLDGDLILEDGTPMPGRLDRIGASTRWRRFLGDGALVGLTTSVGSASDRPVSGDHTVAVSATAFARWPVRERDAWVFFLAYGDDRGDLDHIPLPGILYQWVKDETLTVIAGVPLVGVRWRPDPHWSFNAGATIFATANAEIGWLPLPTPALRLRAAVAWRHDQWTLSEVGGDDDRLVLRELRAILGAEVTPRPGLTIDVAGGRLFARRAFLGEDARDDGDAIRLDDGWYAAAGASLGW